MRKDRLRDEGGYPSRSSLGKERTGAAKCLQLAPEGLSTALSSQIWRVEKEPLRVLGAWLGSWAPLSVFVSNALGRHPVPVTSLSAVTRHLRKTT